MSTLERDASAAWSALRSVWPHLVWTRPVYSHGAFHHVAVLDSNGVVRVSFAADHDAQITREASALLALSSAGLKTRIPKLLRTHTDDTWSAMACTFIKGAHAADQPWDLVRQDLAGILDDLRSAQLPTGLPSVRSWCGGDAWPDVVERITAECGPRVQKTARIVVREVLEIEEVTRSLVHGDFGPHNILWDESGAPALIDFDNACVADPVIDICSPYRVLRRGQCKGNCGFRCTRPSDGVPSVPSPPGSGGRGACGRRQAPTPCTVELHSPA